MLVLVDYDNIERTDRAAGPRAVLARIAEVICASLPNRPSRLDFRLYGGWYELAGPTRTAQALSLDLQKTFPYAHRPPSTPALPAVILNAELAYAQLVDPNLHLLHTFRIRSYPKGLRAQAPAHKGCPNPQHTTCGLRHLPDLLRTGRCPEHGCNLRADDLLFKDEQKLVDVMLAADLLHHSTRSPADPIAIVSSDQDLWPAMKQAIANATPIRHVHTTPNGRTPSHYSRGITTNYKELHY